MRKDCNEYLGQGFTDSYNIGSSGCEHNGDRGYIAMLVREWEERFERKRAERLARQEQMEAQARQAGLEEGRQAGLEEGHEMERKVWIAWAEQRGLPIDELPPPSSRT